MRKDTLFWEDVQVGQEMTPAEVKITYAMMIAEIGGSKNLAAVHHNPEFAKAAGNRDMFVETPWLNALMFRFITDWAGPEAWVYRLLYNMRESNIPGDTMRGTGKVTKKFVYQGKAYVEVHLDWKNDLFHTEDGDATVQLPTRGKQADTVTEIESWIRPIENSDDLDEATRSAIGKEFRSELSDVEVNRWMVRNQCEPVEDGNPVYSDDAFAKKTRYGAIIAPPHMNSTWLRGRPFPYKEAPQVGAWAILPQYGFNIVGSPYEEWYSPLYMGDRVYSVSKLIGVSGEKRTRRGLGRFCTGETRYYNQKDQLLSRSVMASFRFNAFREGPPPPTQKWEQVKVGDKLPEKKQPVQIVLPATMFQSFCKTFVTEWAGSEAKITDMDFKALEIGPFSWAGPGAILVLGGSVTDKRQAGKKKLVVVEGKAVAYGKYVCDTFKITIELP